jgi:hypothetical protein
LLAGAFHELGIDFPGWEELGVAHEAGEFVGVGRADVDIWQCVGAVEKLGGEAEVWNGLPDKKRFSDRGVEGFAASEDGGYKLDAAGG